jgi:hypothetical protein
MGVALENKLTALIGAGGSTAEQTAAIGNTQSGANITGLVPSSAYKKHIVDYWVKRIATATVMEVGTLVAWWDGTTWQISRVYYAGNAGIDFDINAATGQVIYTTDTMAGTYDTTNSKMGWMVRTQG